MADLTKDDLQRLLQEHVTQRMETGFTDINDRLDTLNGRTRANEVAIAVLQDRSSDTRKGGAMAGGIGAGIVALAEFARHWFMGGK